MLSLTSYFVAELADRIGIRYATVPYVVRFTQNEREIQ